MYILYQTNSFSPPTNSFSSPQQKADTKALLAAAAPEQPYKRTCCRKLRATAALAAVSDHEGHARPLSRIREYWWFN